LTAETALRVSALHFRSEVHSGRSFTAAGLPRSGIANCLPHFRKNWHFARLLTRPCIIRDRTDRSTFGIAIHEYSILDKFAISFAVRSLPARSRAPPPRCVDVLYSIVPTAMYICTLHVLYSILFIVRTIFIAASANPISG